MQDARDYTMRTQRTHMFTYLKPNYTNSMNFPRRNEDLRAQEEADLHGQDLTVICRFVDGSKASYKVRLL